MYQIAISSKTRLQWLLLSDAIHTLIYVSALVFGFEDGLIIPGFWVRIPEGPPGFSTGQAICLACFLFHGISFHLQIACLLTSGRPRSAACDAAATKPAHLLRLTPTPRPYPVFRENRRPSTCGFIYVRDAMVGGCRPNVVDGPVSWRGSRGRPEWSLIGGRRQRRPPAGRAPRAWSGIEGPRRPGRAPASAPRALVSAVAAPRDSGARAPGKFFQKCPCIAARVPV